LNETTAKTFECENGHQFTVLLHGDAGLKRPASLDDEGALKMRDEPICVVFGCYAHSFRIGTTVVEELQEDGRMNDEKESRAIVTESCDLQCWFNLSYASWLTLPRVLMEAMPVAWQDRMAALLNEYDEAFPNQPDIGTRVQITDSAGHLTKTPPWLINYRRPNREKIEELRQR
jgi:hypothetical protein